jgi:hypothetical protein
VKLTREQHAGNVAVVRAAITDPVIVAVLAILEQEYERTMDALLWVPLTEVQVLQGEAQAYRKLLKSLKEQRPTPG